MYKESGSRSSVTATRTNRLAPCLSGNRFHLILSSEEPYNVQ